jgi:hypothetical protein
MYRHGLGDCFLITLPRTSGDRPYYVLIDCGVVLGTADASNKMTKVVENIATVTKGEIDLLLATHEHWDHLSGFVQAKDTFDSKLTVHELWLGWTEDSDDKLTQKLKKEKNAALAVLRLGLSRLQLAGAAEQAAELGGILDFFGAAKGASTADALNNVKKMTSKKRYFVPGEDPVQSNGVPARFYVLGPPHNEKQLRKMNPSVSNKEAYGLALDGFQMFIDGAGAALEGDDEGRPFDQQYEIPFHYAETLDFFKDNYWQPKDGQNRWRRIDTDWLAGSTELALQLDSLTNNTSLAVAIELTGGDVLLFAADAQVGNWLSWQDLKWTVDGKTVSGPDLLAHTIFYKVGHHGSHNGTLTLKEQGLEQMKKLRVAMIPVDHDMAVKKHWGKMPLDELVAALEKQTQGAVIRIDRPKPTTRLQLIEDKLFFELTL